MSTTGGHGSERFAPNRVPSKSMWGMQTCLGIFPSVETAVQSLQKLQENGIPPEQVSAITSVPYPHGALPVKEPKVPLPKISVAGGVLGVLAGIALIAFTSAAYPIKTGHMPIIPGLPTSLVAYEIMMLSIVLSTLAGLIFGAGLAKLKRRIYDPLLSQGYIGILVLCKLPDQVELAQRIFGEHRAEKILLKDGNDL